ncbi:cation:proton antiporter [Candidatus Micrarchaeota archaeon]|nr:cation:proton antiporter [Candidatus Micrarchaeota archaeon]
MGAKRRAIGKIAGSARPYLAPFLSLLAAFLFLSVLRASLFSAVDADKRIWFELSFLLLSAILANLLVVHLRQPTVMVLLIVGMLISPGSVALLYPFLAGGANYLASIAFGFAPFPSTVPRLVSNEGIVAVFAQLGAIILLFKIGLECEFHGIFNVRNFAVGLLGVILPFVAGFHYATLTGHPLGYAVFLAAALTATSVGVTVAVLSELKVMEREFARVIVGAAVIDDVLALLVLSLVRNLPTGLDAAALAPVGLTALAALVFIAGGIAIGRFVVEKYFNGSLGEKEFLGILAYTFAYAYVAEFIGLSAIVGAFIAGLTLNFGTNSKGIFALFAPLESFFTPIFFISLGMLLNVTALAQNIVPIIAITLIAALTKVLACSFASGISGMKWKDSLTVGIGMIPRGEIALIIGLYGLTALGPDGKAILGPAEYAIIASMAFLTTVMVPPLLTRVVGKDSATPN